MTAPPCTLHYVDVGSNRGDSLKQFVAKQPDEQLRRMLDAALPAWSPQSTCVHAFEPNTRWTRTLESVNRSLAPYVATLNIHLGTAMMTGSATEARLSDKWSRNKYSEGASVAVGFEGHGKVKVARVKAANMVHFFRTLPWPSLPIVVRLDVEGMEYKLLRALAVSGLGASRRLFVAVEWHRFLKHRALEGREKALMERFDLSFGHFNRAPKALPPKMTGEWGKGDGASSVMENYEKILAFMLAAANITLAEHPMLNATRDELGSVA
jgi:hypothetical protein